VTVSVSESLRCAIVVTVRVAAVTENAIRPPTWFARSRVGDAFAVGSTVTGYAGVGE
jgi:hypothetical protein